MDIWSASNRRENRNDIRAEGGLEECRGFLDFSKVNSLAMQSTKEVENGMTGEELTTKRKPTYEKIMTTVTKCPDENVRLFGRD